MSIRHSVTRRFFVFLFILGLIILSLSAISLAQTIQLPARKTNAAQPRSAKGSPVAVSPGNWSQLSKFISGHPSVFYFGDSTAISGDTVVVTAQTSFFNSRVAYIFQKTSGGWGNTLPVAALSLPTSTFEFSSSVAIDGDTIVVGVPSFGSGSPSYVYVYVKPAGGWANMKPTATLTPSDSLDGYFGLSVAISGNSIVVGDFGGFLNSATGAAYVFEKRAKGWVNSTETAKLTASDVLPTDRFGISVSIAGDTIAVGAPQTQAGPGKAYVFVEPAGGWTDMNQTAELTATDGEISSEVGSSVSVDGDNILAGAPGTYDLNYPPGSAYLFTKPAGGWVNMTQTAEFSPGDARPQENFGDSVAISGKLVAIGAPRRGVPPNRGEGGIYIFEKPAGGWQNASGLIVLTGADARIGATLGVSVGISGKVVVGGAETFYSPGAAYLFGLQ